MVGVDGEERRRERVEERINISRSRQVNLIVKGLMSLPG